MEHIVETLVHIFSGVIPAELTVFALSLMPIIELRGRSEERRVGKECL